MNAEEFSDKFHSYLQARDFPAALSFLDEIAPEIAVLDRPDYLTLKAIASAFNRRFDDEERLYLQSLQEGQDIEQLFNYVNCLFVSNKFQLAREVVGQYDLETMPSRFRRSYFLQHLQVLRGTLRLMVDCSEASLGWVDLNAVRANDPERTYDKFLRATITKLRPLNLTQECGQRVDDFVSVLERE